MEFYVGKNTVDEDNIPVDQVHPGYLRILKEFLCITDSDEYFKHKNPLRNILMFWPKQESRSKFSLTEFNQ